MASQVIWCLGMYGSASTWLLNAVRQICEFAQQDKIQIYFVSTRREFPEFAQPGVTHLVKSHEISDDGTIVALSGRADKILMTMRDPRDAVTSLMAYHGHDFDKALGLVGQTAHLCMGFAKDRRTQLFQYESGFFEEQQTIHKLAGILGHQLPDEAAQRIFSGLQRGEVEKYIAGLRTQPGVLQDRLSGDLLDPATQWHTHHAGRSGEVGRWQNMLSAAQVKIIEERLHDVFGRFNAANN
jgi:hypothetical protein